MLISLFVPVRICMCVCLCVSVCLIACLSVFVDAAEVMLRSAVVCSQFAVRRYIND